MVSEVKNDQKDSNIIHNLFDRSYKMEGRIEVKSENEGILEKERAIGMQKKRVKWKYTHREGEMIVVRNATQERPCTKNDL